ncbi:Uncharacterised protein [Serratia quinivorans]|nr:Uncharacterised protein [Serratia quinivorans]
MFLVNKLRDKEFDFCRSVQAKRPACHLINIEVHKGISALKAKAPIAAVNGFIVLRQGQGHVGAFPQFGFHQRLGLARQYCIDAPAGTGNQLLGKQGVETGAVTIKLHILGTIVGGMQGDSAFRHLWHLDGQGVVGTGGNTIRVFHRDFQG